MLLLTLLDKKMKEGVEAEDEKPPLIISLPAMEKVDIGVQAIDDDMESAHLRCLEDLKAKEVELRGLQAFTQQLQQELGQLQCQRDEAQQLLGEQEQIHRSTVEDLKKELEFLESCVKLAQGEKLNPLIDDYKVLIQAQESALLEKDEDFAKLREILQNTMALLNAAEADVLSGKERIAELDHKNQQLLAEQQEALARVSELEGNCESKSAELQRLLEKSSELQLHLDSEQSMHHHNHQESLLKQKVEECAETREALGNISGLWCTAEAQVLSGREKMTELEKVNAELDRKNQQVLAELQEALARVSKLEMSYESQSAEFQKIQEKSSELQRHLDMQNMHHQDHQESLLKQKVEECAETREALENISGLWRTAEAQVLSAREKMTELEKVNAELDRKNQQVLAELQEALARVSKLEMSYESQSAELQKIQEKSSELQRHLDTKQNMHHQSQQELDELHTELKLEKDRVCAKETELQSYLVVNDQLLASQREVSVLKEELQKLLDEKSKLLNKYNDKKESFMDKLCTAKLAHSKVMRFRDEKIKELQRNCDFLTKQVGKVKETTVKMEEVNSQLWKENHEFQCELLTEREGHETCRLRIQYLEKMTEKMNNLVLEQRTRCPSPHVAQGKFPSATNQSALPWGDMVQNTHTAVKLEGRYLSPAQSLTRTHSSEMGYLNLTPPLSPPLRQMLAESSGAGSEEVLQADNRRSCFTERFL
ncbi:paramyosin-like [Sardina pilchardus]|uniref:paramyosin-like n=1 Tax=Sardina pilchardus TaxID=27697 RepID=UPI002E10CA74